MQCGTTVSLKLNNQTLNTTIKNFWDQFGSKNIFTTHKKSYIQNKTNSRHYQNTHFH